MTADREFKLRLQAESAASRQRVRETVMETVHPDKDKILAEFDRNMWDIETGVMGARATWGALSETQRRVLLAMGEGRYLTRAFNKTFNACGPFGGFKFPEVETIFEICRLPTVKNLRARKLIESDNPSDPMKRLVLSDYGRFVLKRGIS